LDVEVPSMAVKASDKKTTVKKVAAKKAPTAKVSSAKDCPLDHTPNAETAKAIRELRAGKGLRRHTSTKEMLDEFGG
jgi:hypothetical protein